MGCRRCKSRDSDFRGMPIACVLDPRQSILRPYPASEYQIMRICYKTNVSFHLFSTYRLIATGSSDALSCHPNIPFGVRAHGGGMIGATSQWTALGERNTKPAGAILGVGVVHDVPPVNSICRPPRPATTSCVHWSWRLSAAFCGFRIMETRRRTIAVSTLYKARRVWRVISEVLLNYFEFLHIFCCVHKSETS